MSANGNTNVVMEGVTHGACDYLIKPVRMEELRNIWQHVVRKKGRVSPKWGPSCDETLSEMPENLFNKKRKEVHTVCEISLEDASNLKKARVNWTVDLHQRFVNAVNQLGLEKAVPKKLLAVMNVKGLTRENVASHLQKYRLYLKRLSGVTPEPCPIASFQASKGGKLGGTMRIMPGGRNLNSRSSKGLSISGSHVGGHYLDQEAMNLNQQRIANRAQVLEALGFDESHPITGCGRIGSLDASTLLRKTQLVSMHSMPCETVAKECQPIQLDEMRSLSGGQVEGFVDNWNIKPVPMHVGARCEAASGQMHGKLDNLICEIGGYDCSSEMQASQYGDITSASCASAMVGTADAEMDILDLTQNPHQLSISDYLMYEEDI